MSMNTNDTIKTSKQWDGLWLATFGDFDLGDAIGTGATEAQAVADLYLWADIEQPVSVFVGHDSEGMARYITRTI
jgi:hypothetical protein